MIYTQLLKDVRSELSVTLGYLESMIIYNYLEVINIEAGEEAFNRAFQSTIIRMT